MSNSLCYCSKYRPNTSNASLGAESAHSENKTWCSLYPIAVSSEDGTNDQVADAQRRQMRTSSSCTTQELQRWLWRRRSNRIGHHSPESPPSSPFAAFGQRRMVPELAHSRYGRGVIREREGWSRCLNVVLEPRYRGLQARLPEPTASLRPQPSLTEEGGAAWSLVARQPWIEGHERGLSRRSLRRSLVGCGQLDAKPILRDRRFRVALLRGLQPTRHATRVKPPRIQSVSAIGPWPCRLWRPWRSCGNDRRPRTRATSIYRPCATDGRAGSGRAGGCVSTRWVARSIARKGYVDGVLRPPRKGARPNLSRRRLKRWPRSRQSRHERVRYPLSEGPKASVQEHACRREGHQHQLHHRREHG